MGTPTPSIPQSKCQCSVAVELPGNKRRSLLLQESNSPEVTWNFGHAAHRATSPKQQEEILATRGSGALLMVLCLSQPIINHTLLRASLSFSDNRASLLQLLKVHSNNFKRVYESCSVRPCPLAQPVGETQRHHRLASQQLMQPLSNFMQRLNHRFS